MRVRDVGLTVRACLRCRYAEMYDMFALIDGGGAGVSADDDSRISLEELVAGIDKVNATEWVALKGKTAADAEALFKEMDDDGAGEVLLVEWCEYLKKKEMTQRMGMTVAVKR